MSVLNTGQISVSSTAQRLSSTTRAPDGILIKAHSTNSASVFFGPSGTTVSTGFQLEPGASFEFDNATRQGFPSFAPADIFVVGTSGDKVSWLAVTQ